MTEVVSALQSPGVREAFRHIGWLRTISKNVFRKIWKNFLPRKVVFWRIFHLKNPILTWFCEKTPLTHVCLNKNRLGRLVSMRAGELESLDVDKASRYLEWLHTTSRKMFSNIWKNFLPTKSTFLKQFLTSKIQFWLDCVKKRHQFTFDSIKKDCDVVWP